MRLHYDDTLSLSPSDLSSHLACPHLTTLSLAAARGEIVKPKLDSPHRDLIFSKGNEHEAAYLARLEAEGRSIVRIPTYDDEGFDAGEAQRLTEEAIRAGVADVIYQPYLTDGTWRGFADFLEQQPDGGYEPVDTKLARTRQAGARAAADVLRRAGGADLRALRSSGFMSRTGSASARRSGSSSSRRTTGACASGSSPRSRTSPRRTAGRRATAASATSGTCAGSSASTTTTSRSSPGCGGCRRRR